MKSIICSAAAGALAACATAQSDDEASADRDDLLAIVDDFFDALAKGEPERWSAHTLSGTNRIAAFQTPDGTDGVRITDVDAFNSAYPSGDSGYLERYWDPKVLSDGRVAVVWAPFDFHIRGDFSHCGVNIFEFVRVDGTWKVANLVWSMEREACTPSPLGPVSE